MTLPKLTLLIGRNNVGKSSAYLPLLLLKQTLDAQNPQTALLGRGDLVDVGQFKDFASNHDSGATVTLRVSLIGQEPRLQDEHTPAAIETSFQSSVLGNAFVSKQRIENPKGDALITRSRNAPEAAFNFTSSLLPTKKSTGRPYREITEVRRAFREEQPDGFLFPGIAGLLIPRIVREDKDRWAAVRDWYNSAFKLFEVQRAANNSFEALLTDPWVVERG